MKESFYFPHDTNAIQDPKMFALLVECGISGIGLYWIIVELMHQQVDGKMSYESYVKIIKFYSNMNNQGTALGDRIQQAFNKCGLFVEQDGMVYSDRVLRNKQFRSELHTKRSIAGKKSAQVRAISTNDAKQVLNKCLTSVEQGKESKGKEKKVFQKPSLQEITQYIQTNGFRTNPAKFLAYNESKGWVVGKHPMKDWKAAVRTWELNATERTQAKTPEQLEREHDQRLRAEAMRNK